MYKNYQEISPVFNRYCNVWYCNNNNEKKKELKLHTIFLFKGNITKNNRKIENRMVHYTWKLKDESF